MITGSRAVFLDRDGVINRNRSDYVKSWSEFEFMDGALPALARLAQTDFLVFVITNQSAIARGLTTHEQVQDIHRRMIDHLARWGGRVDDIFYCPHHPDAGCACRKPLPGLLLQAGARRDIDLSSSYMIGDSLEDMQAGLAAGCTTLLVKTGRGMEAIERLEQWRGPRPIVVPDLAAAIDWIIRPIDDSSK